MKTSTILSAGFAAMAAARVAKRSDSYCFEPEDADSIWTSDIPVLYTLNETQSNSLGGSWWASSFITSKDNEQFLVLSHVLSAGDTSYFRGSTLDLKTLEYNQFITLGDGITNTSSLDLEINGSGIKSSSADSISIMHAYSKSDNVTFDLSWNATSHALINAGSGKFTFGAGTTVEWGLPNCRTEGTITARGGQEFEIDPDNSFTWYDRQYGEGGTVTGNWTWFELHIPQTSYKMSVWMINNPDTAQESNFATIRGSDDELQVVPVEWTADYTRSYQSTASTNVVYPLDWTVKIGTLGEFQISSIVPDQEIAGTTPLQTAYEGFVTFDGIFDSKKVAGYGLVELVFNSWE